MVVQNMKPWEREQMNLYQHIQISAPEEILIFSTQTAKPAIVMKALDLH